MPDPLLRTEGIPSLARATVTEQRQLGRRMVHILTYVPERRGAKIDMIEEPIEINHAKLSLRNDGRKPSRVYLAPTGEELSFTICDGYTSVSLPAVSGYCLVVFEGLS